MLVFDGWHLPLGSPDGDGFYLDEVAVVEMRDRHDRTRRTNCAEYLAEQVVEDRPSLDTDQKNGHFEHLLGTAPRGAQNCEKIAQGLPHLPFETSVAFGAIG